MEPKYVTMCEGQTQGVHRYSVCIYGRWGEDNDQNYVKNLLDNTADHITQMNNSLLNAEYHT